MANNYTRGSGAYDWIGPRVRSEKALTGGIKRDAKTNQQVGAGGSKAGNTARKVRTTVSGNKGSFKRKPG